VIRDAAAILALHAAFGLLGAWTLAALGVRLRPNLAHAGLALLTGIAAAIAVLTPLAYVGVAPTPLTLAALVAAAAVAASRRPAPRIALGGPAPPAWFAVPALAVVALLAASAATRPAIDFDAYSGWLLKARMLASSGHLLFGRLDAAIFGHGAYGFTASEYPLGKPVLDGLALRLMGVDQVRAVHVEGVIVLAAFVGTAWSLLADRVSRGLLAAALLTLLLMPRVQVQSLTAYADVPTACLVAAAGLALLRHARDREPAFAALAAVLAAAGALVKEDGVAGVVALLGVAAVAEVVRRDRAGLLRVLAAAAAVAVALAPWTIYVKLHDIHETDVQLSPGRTLDSLDHLGEILSSLGRYLAGDGYLFVPILALVLAVAAAVLGDRLALAVLAALALLVSALVLVYLNATLDLPSMLRSSAPRTLLQTVFVAACAVPVLAERLARRR
jgi:hypothetical protein